MTLDAPNSPIRIDLRANWAHSRIYANLLEGW